MSNEVEMLRKMFGGDARAQGLVNALAVLAGGTAGDGKVYNPTVVREGDKILIPEGADLGEVISALKRQQQSEGQVVRFVTELPVSPWDGAYALREALQRELGVVIHNGCDAGCCPPTQFDVEIGVGKTTSVPWGTFALATMSGATISTGVTMKDGRMVFQCEVKCERRFESRLRRLLDTIRDIAEKESLHRGKAFSIAFNDESGQPIKMPMPKFFRLTPEQPIFSRELSTAIERNIFVPIRHAEKLAAKGESLKRGVAFVGEYGVGKTLLASHVARAATAAGWTFIYVKNSAELPMALRYAQQYQPVVVFAEDVDRIAGLERTESVNQLLNQLDGIDGKAVKIMTIVTSNHADRINAAMRRPGRIDLVLEVKPPDEETVGRMIEEFTGEALEPGTDLDLAKSILAGQVPARVRETVGRARLESIRRTGDVGGLITGEDLAAVAKEVTDEFNLFQPQKVDTTHVHRQVLADALGGIADSLREEVASNGRAHAVAAS